MQSRCRGAVAYGRWCTDAEVLRCRDAGAVVKMLRC